MIICNTIDNIRQQIATWKSQGLRVAFVATMGNLHAGHLALLEQAQQLADKVVVSIFVNPLQFNENTDFDIYPRTLEQDIAQLQRVQADALFAPTAEEVYPQGPSAVTQVIVPGLGDILEGECRPGHFTGVATVVNKLFNMVQPDIALFGEKDYQQLSLIRRMVDELNMAIEICGVATCRQADGLALSSRNGRLDAEQSQLAPVLYQVLSQLRDRVLQGERDYAQLEAEAMENLSLPGVSPEYIAIREASHLTPAGPGDTQLVVLGAIRLGATRLIDNIPFSVS